MSRPVKNQRLFHSKNAVVGNPRHIASEGRKQISRKIRHLVREEDKTPAQAAGQAFGMARAGDLGPGAKRVAGRKRR